MCFLWPFIGALQDIHPKHCEFPLKKCGKNLTGGFARRGTRFAIAQVPKSVDAFFASRVQVRIVPETRSRRELGLLNQLIYTLSSTSPGLTSHTFEARSTYSVAFK